MKNTIAYLLITTLSLLCIQCESVSLKPDEKKLFIASTKVDCMGVAPMKCLQIKESKSGKWQNLHQNIEGFEFKEGYEYEIIVKTVKRPNPPADASSIKYVFVRQLSSTKE